MGLKFGQTEKFKSIFRLARYAISGQTFETNKFLFDKGIYSRWRSSKNDTKISILFIFHILYVLCFHFSDLWYTNINKWNIKTTTSASMKKRHQLCLNGRYKNILLLVNFNHPFYQNIPLLKLLYSRIFPNMVFYGTVKSNKFEVKKIDSKKGFLSYIGLADAMETYHNYTGYLLINDDILLNSWSLDDLDQQKIWEGPTQPISIKNVKRIAKWYWWKHPRWGLPKCLLARNESTVQYPDYVTLKYSNAVDDGNDDADNHIKGCYRGRSDVLYIPRQFSKQFITLSKIFYKHDVFLELAIPTMVRMIVDKSTGWQLMRGVYVPGRVNDTSIRDTTILWSVYNEQLHFIHPVKMNYAEYGTQLNKIKMEKIIKKINLLTKTCLNDKNAF